MNRVELTVLAKLKHWCGSQGENGLQAAPILGLVVLDAGRMREPMRCQ